MFLNIIKQDILINIKNISGIIQSTVFFLIVVSIFGITTDINNNVATAIAVIWICLTFAILLSANNFQKDFDDGTFEQLILSGYIFEVIIFAKIIANWLSNSLPLIVILPIIALLFKLDENLIINLLAIAVLATLIINFLVSLGSALTLSSNQTSSFLTILILPLLIPIIIFANSGLGSDFGTAIKFLSALLIFLIPILTFAITAAVKINVID